MGNMFDKLLTSLDAVADCQIRAARLYLKSEQVREANRAMDCYEFASRKAARLRASVV